MSESIVLGGGCFWCLEAAFNIVRGVEEVVSGYAGGTDNRPTYEAVRSGETGHAEVVMITYQPEIISLQNILRVFWTIHDPTTLNRQGADVGTQYRSIILFMDENQRRTIEISLREAEDVWQKLTTTEIKLLDAFYPAEAYHQNYYAQHPEQAYCRSVIDPKLSKLRTKVADLLI